MNQQGRRAAPGIALVTAMAIGGAAMVLGIGSCAPESEAPIDGTTETGAPIDAATQGRTPIEVAALGPQVGERVPDFSLPDQNGRVRTLESIAGRNGAMLLFHRSADW